MKFSNPFKVMDQSVEQRQQAQRYNRNAIATCLAVFAACMLLPEAAWAAADFSFPIVDDLMCGFIKYSKSKLAPYIAVLVIIIGVVGHWLGATKVWGMLLYVALGLGIIMGIGALISNATGAGASCLVG